MAEEQLAAAKGAWEVISSSLQPEVESFQAQANRDFTMGLRTHVLQQLEFETAQQEHWRQLLAVFEHVPSFTK